MQLIAILAPRVVLDVAIKNLKTVWKNKSFWILGMSKMRVVCRMWKVFPSSIGGVTVTSVSIWYEALWWLGIWGTRRNRAKMHYTKVNYKKYFCFQSFDKRFVFFLEYPENNAGLKLHTRKSIKRIVWDYFFTLSFEILYAAVVNH